MVAELNNTFGERLPQLLDGGGGRYEAEKRLHVSPFNGLDQRYEYAFSEPGDEVWARIHVREGGRHPLTAVLHGRRQELTNASLARFLVRYPLMPLQVVGLIHWQALKLFAKRVPFHRKPPFVPGSGRCVDEHCGNARGAPPASAAPRTCRAAAARARARRRRGRGARGPHARRTSGVASATARPCGSRSRTNASSRVSRRGARSGSASRTRRGNGAPTTSSRSSSCCCGTPSAGRRRHPHLTRFLPARPRLNRRQGPLAARRNIEAHYDLGNALFELMLDASMTYSCAIFEDENEPLEEAQLRKLRRVCEQLRLEPGENVLEIGCGWGSFALVAAREYGVRVTGLTLSPAQAELARERVGLPGSRTASRSSWRTTASTEGSYDKVASIEMIEAIGERQLPMFFAAVERFLAPGGVACVQTILVPDERWPRYRRTPDWIERHVFPGCLIPSLGALRSAIAHASGLQIDGIEEIGPHYAETLRRWRQRFHDTLEDVRALGYDERFVRTWDFYLAFCEAAFRTRWLGDAQLVLRR